MNNDRYRYIKDLGKGGSGCTRLVYDRHLGMKKVLKEVVLSSSEQMESFIRETDTLKAVKHIGIPVITDQWVTRNTGYFIMDYCEGPTLDEYIRMSKRINLSKVLSLSCELAELISFLHDSNPRIIHGDLKPENLILSPTGLCLLDFGTAYFEKGCSGSHALAFTYGYASPSIMNGEKCTIESDIYALGMIFFFMLTGRDVRDFPGKVIGCEDFPSEFDTELKCIFSNCLDGYHHLSEFVDDIHRYMSSHPSIDDAKAAHALRREIFGSPFYLIKKTLRSFLDNRHRRKDYVRLENTLLTDGGHLLFAMLIGLCIGALFGLKYPIQPSAPSQQASLPFYLQTKSGENILLKQGSIYEDSSCPSIQISDRSLKDTGVYDIQVSVNHPGGSHMSQSFAYKKISAP